MCFPNDYRRPSTNQPARNGRSLHDAQRAPRRSAPDEARHSTSLKKRIGFTAGLSPRLAKSPCAAFRSVSARLCSTLRHDGQPMEALQQIELAVTLSSLHSPRPRSLQAAPVMDQLHCGSPTPSPKRTMPRAPVRVAWARPAAARKAAERGLKSPSCTVYCHRLPAISSHRGPSRRTHVKGFRHGLRTAGMTAVKVSGSKGREGEVLPCTGLGASSMRAMCRQEPQRLPVAVHGRRVGHRCGCKGNFRENYVMGTGLNQSQHPARLADGVVGQLAVRR